MVETLREVDDSQCSFTFNELGCINVAVAVFQALFFNYLRLAHVNIESADSMMRCLYQW